MTEDEPESLTEQQIVEVARAVVRELEPEEIPVFDQVADAWLKDGRKRRRSGKAPGASVGFGIESVLLSQLVLPIIAAAVGEVLGGITRDRLQERRKARHSAAAELKPAASGPVRTSESAAYDALTRQQVDALHDACQAHARTLGLSRKKAVLLADAVRGTLDSLRGGG
jgi:hypothetical protein